MAFLNKHKIINPNQQGFLEGKSCLTNLLETFEEWTTALDVGHGLYVIYLDYRNAFDTVPNYILYVNEIPDLAQCIIKMFAEDTKLYAPIKSQTDQEQLQSDIDTLEEWTRDWLLDFNAHKCELMQIGRPPPRTYTMTSTTKEEKM